MTNKCKSCIGKYGHIQLTEGMVMEAISWLNLPKPQIGRSQCERTHRSTVRFNWEGCHGEEEKSIYKLHHFPGVGGTTCHESHGG